MTIISPTTTLRQNLAAKIRTWLVSRNDRMRDAAANGRVDEMIALLDEGASIDAQAAAKMPTDDSASALHRASRAGHIEVVKELLARGANVNLISHHRDTPLGSWAWGMGANTATKGANWRQLPPDLIEVGVCLVEAGADFGEGHTVRGATMVDHINKSPLLIGLMERVQHEAQSRQTQRTLDVSVETTLKTRAWARL